MSGFEEPVEAKGVAFDGTEFVVTRRRWLHIVDRHVELKTMLGTVIESASAPSELFLDPRGSLHILTRLQKGRADFLVLIVRRKASKTYLITAYLIGPKRKERRYRKFRRLPHF